MKTSAIAIGVALLIAAAPAEAKNKNKAVIGCVEHHDANYELSTQSKKGKAKHYTLVGDHNFANDVGHRVQVNGVVGKGTINVGSVKTVAPRCEGK
ncbi:MAG TPA: hypothetical protein VGY57_02475 [Vicinamibacterales bacterium]|jgi:hypothetical protein|nr:hypothetical protein [Vicinamibacterales bacterium]